jgi:hypothetical protein
MKVEIDLKARPRNARMKHASISAAGNVTILMKMLIVFTILTGKNWGRI